MAAASASATPATPSAQRLVRPANTLPGPHSATVEHAHGSHFLNGLDPAHRVVGLTNQCILDAGRIVFDGDVDVVDHRNDRCLQRQLSQTCCQFVGGGTDQRGMERRRNRQRLGHLGATRLAGFHCPLDCALVTGNHGLAVGIEIHRLDDFTLRRFGTGGGDTGIVQAEYGGHGAGADRHRLLHGCGAQANQRHRILEIDDAGGD